MYSRYKSLSKAVGWYLFSRQVANRDIPFCNALSNSLEPQQYVLSAAIVLWVVGSSYSTLVVAFKRDRALNRTLDLVV